MFCRTADKMKQHGHQQITSELSIRHVTSSKKSSSMCLFICLLLSPHIVRLAATSQKAGETANEVSLLVTASCDCCYLTPSAPCCQECLAKRVIPLLQNEHLAQQSPLYTDIRKNLGNFPQNAFATKFLSDAGINKNEIGEGQEESLGCSCCVRAL